MLYFNHTDTKDIPSKISLYARYYFFRRLLIKRDIDILFICWYVNPISAEFDLWYVIRIKHKVIFTFLELKDSLYNVIIFNVKYTFQDSMGITFDMSYFNFVLLYFANKFYRY